MRDYISSLVYQTLNDYIKKERNPSHILVLLSNGREHSKDVWEHIETLANRFHVSLLVSEQEQEQVATLDVHDCFILEKITKEDIDLFSQNMDLLYCPVISHGFLAKLSLLLDDSQSIWVTLQLALEGKEVLLGHDIIQQSRRMMFWQRPSIEKKAQSYVKELRKAGIHFCSMKQALKVISARIKVAYDRKPLVLAKHVEEVAKSGKQAIFVPKNSIITPMAKDVARELHIVIKEKNDEEKRDDL
ncbi:hypothetical protein ACFSKI_09425 [Pseudogracilibacillus auburnensis]|uniref:Ethanolamine utilization protein n=1 Tax=Pseudogracilibacillus auburnensis TaxID=1494959 RepID=A0A2V3VZU9_9BACI|nr:hypothetical protein [Pseudogracilibacillus auburnensis]PXW85525.1 hypothetical protein DFR56_11024 [Pseudogracilibacillus auburnensis]